MNGDTAASLTTLPTLSTAATAASHAGTYTITASGAASGDYAITYVAGSLTVNKASLTITADDQSKTYGAANPTLTASYSGFVNGDAAASLTTLPTISTTATSASHVGILRDHGRRRGDRRLHVYLRGRNADRQQASLTITADDQTKAYGSANPSLTASYSGFVNGDTAASLTTAPTLSTTATTASHVGAYAITASGAASGDYTISYVAGTLTIDQAALTVTAERRSRVRTACRTPRSPRPTAASSTATPRRCSAGRRLCRPRRT